MRNARAIQTFKQNTRGFKQSAVRIMAAIALVIAIALANLALASPVTLLPTQAKAFATESTYTVTQLESIAQVLTNSGLHVVEQRTINFAHADQDVIIWRITGLPSMAEVKVNSVRIAKATPDGAVDGEWQTLSQATFQSKWRDEVQSRNGVAVRPRTDGTQAVAQTSADATTYPLQDAWSFDEQQDTAYVFFEESSPNMVFEIDYTADYAAMAFDDVGELYWDYVPADHSVRVENVNTTVQLPVPEGTAAPLESIAAWGHGAPGSLQVGEDGAVRYSVPVVLPGQYAQAHILFPVRWLTNLNLAARDAYSGTRLDTAIAQETDWTDTYSARTMNRLSIQIAIGAICFIALAVAAFLFLRFGREQKPHLEENINANQLANAIYSQASPAVVGRLMRWNRLSENDFVSTVLDMANANKLRIEMPSNPDLNSNSEHYIQLENIRLHVGKNAKSETTTPIQRETLRILFDIVGEGYQTISIAEIDKFAKMHPRQFAEAMQNWQRTLSISMEARNFFDSKSVKLQKGLAIAGAAFALAGIVGGHFQQDLVQLGFMLSTGIVLLIMAAFAKSRTPEGVLVATEVELLEKAENVRNNKLLHAPKNKRIMYDAQPKDEYICEAEASFYLLDRLDERFNTWFAPTKGRANLLAPCLAEQFSEMLSQNLKQTYKQEGRLRK